MIWAMQPRSRLLCMNVSHLRVRFSVQADEEVERKFIVTPEIERRLLARCVPITRSFTDEYYDIEESYDLSTKDLWLRRRDQTWELKWPMANTNISGLAGIDFYNESCDIKTISEVVLDCTNASALQTAGSSALTDWVSKGVLALFAEITTVRELTPCHYQQLPVILILSLCLPMILLLYFRLYTDLKLTLIGAILQ